MNKEKLFELFNNNRDKIGAALAFAGLALMAVGGIDYRGPAYAIGGLVLLGGGAYLWNRYR